MSESASTSQAAAPAESPLPPRGASPGGPHWSLFTHFAGFDWAKDHHDVTVVDRSGVVAMEMRFDHTAEGWAVFAQKVRAFPTLALTIETSSGAVVERLLEMGLHVYPVHPTAAERFRDRKAPGGVKSDRLDAWCMADALRTDGHAWRRLRPEDPLTQELRLLCRDEVALIEQRTALVNALQAALGEYYPAALDAFDNWTLPSAWAFVERFPAPAELARKGKRQWEKFLHTRKLARPEMYAERLAVFAKAGAFVASPATTRAKSMLAVSLCVQLRALQGQLDEYRRRIQELFAQHPDQGIFSSLPGAGPKLAPRLLAECGTDRDRLGDHEALQCLAGTAPVTRQSGQMRIVKQRLACNKLLKTTVHLWANLSRSTCVWADAYYKKKREQGKTHACAIRCLGQRWLKILWKMWQDRKPYDEAVHTRNQVRHGSWVVRLIAATPPATPSLATPR
jgi:transposase